MLKETDYGIGYDEQGQDNTAGPDEVRRLARLANIGLPDESPYKYRKPTTSDDEAFVTPAGYPESLDDAIRYDLMQASHWFQARAMVLMLACQISLTGYAGKRRATKEEREWGHLMFAAYRAHAQLKRVPGTCRGCNSDPCRCIA